VASALASTEVHGDWVGRYLDFLGVAHAQPGLDALTRLTRAHVLRVPFESVTSVLRRHARPFGPVPPLNSDAVLASWQEGRSGGLCFEVTHMFGRLLVALGYRAHPVLAFITFPGSHQALLVELDGERYLVDAGNGAPFFEPVALTGTVEVRHAGLAYRYRPDGDTWIQDRWIRGAWDPFCRYDLHPPDPAAQEAAYQRHHQPGGSWVVDSMVLVRCAKDEVLSLRNGELTRFTAHGKSVELVETATYPRLAADVFGMPALPIAQAIQALASGHRPPEAAPRE
jgi:N-hydroxyarylamine O-acetyltransferase